MADSAPRAHLSPSRFTVRAARAADVPALAELAARTFPLACPPDLPQAQIAQFITANLEQESFRRYLADPAYFCGVLSEQVGGDGGTTPTPRSGRDGPILGYSLTVEGQHMDPEAAKLLRGLHPLGLSKLYLDPLWQGSGAAAVLLDELIARSRTTGRDSIWLGTNVQNARARAFYERRGFSSRGTRTFYVGAYANQDCVYELMLG